MPEIKLIEYQQPTELVSELTSSEANPGGAAMSQDLGSSQMQIQNNHYNQNKVGPAYSRSNSEPITDMDNISEPLA